MTGVLADQASAQVTSAQQSAIKASCRSDFMAKCSGVTPGGKDALACLQTNVASLSAACKSAVSATVPPPAPKAAAPAAAAVAPAPAETPTPETTEAPAETPAPAPAVAAPPPKAAVVAKPVAVATAGAPPTAAQQSAMKQACRSDFMAKCSGVTPGGKDALVCLQRNVAGLSPACKQVVSATMGGAPAPAAAVATAPAAAPTPQQLSAVKFTCRGDFTRHCRGIQPGGPEALACLQRSAARLTPDCRTSLAALGDAVPASAAAATTTTVVAEPERRRLPPGITPVGRVLRRVMEHNQ
ncbi:MAG TPA: hypothetical protein VGJ01_16375 [Pseudolabrys sp.]